MSVRETVHRWIAFSPDRTDRITGAAYTEAHFREICKIPKDWDVVLNTIHQPYRPIPSVSLIRQKTAKEMKENPTYETKHPNKWEVG